MNKRRPRHERVEPERRPPFRFEPRDGEIIKAINDCRALKERHIETLFFDSPKPANKRLQKLFQHEYLDRLFISQVGNAPAASPIVYTITKLGASVLATTFGYTTDQFRFPTRAVKDAEKLQHILAIADVWSSFIRACSDTNIEVLSWQDELVFRAAPDTVRVKKSSGLQKAKPVLPDGYLHLQTPKGQARFFLEIDRGVEGLQQVKDQIEVYQEYIQSGGYKERFQATSLRILIVTSSINRLSHLERAIAQVGGGDRYWLTTFQEATPTQIMTAPIWTKVGQEGRFSLLG